MGADPYLTLDPWFLTLAAPLLHWKRIDPDGDDTTAFVALYATGRKSRFTEKGKFTLLFPGMETGLGDKSPCPLFYTPYPFTLHSWFFTLNTLSSAGGKREYL